MDRERRVHFLSLLLGDRFRFAEGGPIFEVCRGPKADDDRPHCVQVEPPDSPRQILQRVEYEGCFVFEVPTDDQDLLGDADHD